MESELKAARTAAFLFSEIMMGQAKLKESATSKLITKFPICALCGERPSSTRDHIPPKALFDNSFRPDKLVVPACDDCNRGTSTADLVASIVSRWNYRSDDIEIADHRRLAARIRKQAPEIIAEWIKMKPGDGLAARLHLEKHGLDVPVDAGLVSIGPNTIRQLNLFAYKIALGFFFEHFQMPMPPNGIVSAIWRTKEDFGKIGPPREVLDMMPDYASLTQGKWDTREQFEYRHSVNRDDGIMGAMARFRTSLYVTFFAIKDKNILPKKERTIDWIASRDLLGILNRPEFQKRIQ